MDAHGHGKAALDPIAVRPREAARAIGLSRSKVYELIAAGEIVSVREGAARLIPVDELHGWLARRRAVSNA